MYSNNLSIYIHRLKRELLVKREAEQAGELRALKLKQQKIKSERSKKDAEIKYSKFIVDQVVLAVPLTIIYYVILEILSVS